MGSQASSEGRLRSRSFWKRSISPGGSRGQVVAVVGESGVGKSRLFREFAHSHRTDGCLVLEAALVSYGRATTYLPVIELLRGYFRIEPHDDVRKIRGEGDGHAGLAGPGLGAGAAGSPTLGDPTLQVVTQYYLLLACHLSGDYPGTEHHSRTLLRLLQASRLVNGSVLR